MGYSTGWGGEMHLHNGTALQELLGVTECDPGDSVADEVEVTTLKAADRFKEFIPGMIDGGELTATINHVPNSATDQLLLAAKAAADTRAWKVVFPDDDGTPLRKYEGTGFVKQYKINPLKPGEAMTATLVIRCSGARTEGSA